MPIHPSAMLCDATKQRLHEWLLAVPAKESALIARNAPIGEMLKLQRQTRQAEDLLAKHSADWYRAFFTAGRVPGTPQQTQVARALQMLNI